MPARLTVVTTFWVALEAAVTRCTLTSSLEAIMPLGSRTPDWSSRMKSWGSRCRTSRSSGRVMARARSTAWRTSSRVISRGREPRLIPPWLFNPRTCEPAMPTTAFSIGAPLEFSACSIAFCTEATAFSRSTISPLREPRDSAMPCPRYRRPPSVTSTTSTEVLALPRSIALSRLLFSLPMDPTAFSELSSVCQCFSMSVCQLNLSEAHLSVCQTSRIRKFPERVRMKPAPFRAITASEEPAGENNRFRASPGMTQVEIGFMEEALNYQVSQFSIPLFLCPGRGLVTRLGFGPRERQFCRSRAWFRWTDGSGCGSGLVTIEDDLTVITQIHVAEVGVLPPPLLHVPDVDLVTVEKIGGAEVDHYPTGGVGGGDLDVLGVGKVHFAQVLRVAGAAGVQFLDERGVELHPRGTGREGLGFGHAYNHGKGVTLGSVGRSAPTRGRQVHDHAAGVHQVDLGADLGEGHGR